MVKNMWVCNNINVYRSEWTSEEYSSVKNMWVCNKVNIYIYVDQSGHHKNRVKNMWVYNKVNVYRSECPSEEKG